MKDLLIIVLVGFLSTVNASIIVAQNGPSKDRYAHLGLPPESPFLLRPIFSPDGKSIAFNSNKGGVVDIYILEVATGEVTQVTTGSGNKYVPRWSPDGSQLIYYKYRGNPWSGASHHDIFRINTDGTDNKLMVTDPSDDMFGDWLADGASLVFVSNRGTARNLYSFDFDSEETKPLLEDSETEFVAFQPKVDWRTGNILFESSHTGNSNIWLYKKEENRYYQLTDTPVNEYGPSFSPAGDRVVFQIDHVNGQIGVMNIDGTDYHAITNQGNFTTPSWGPDGSVVAIYNEPDSDDPDLKKRRMYLLNDDGSGMEMIFEW